MKRSFSLLCIGLLATFAALADVKISELPDAAALTGAEQVPAVQSGTTVKTTTGDIADLILPVNMASAEVTGTLPVANGGTGATTLTGPLKGNGTAAIGVAASTDIRGLWSGTCDATTFLRGDGSCQVPSGTATTGTFTPTCTAVSNVSSTTCSLSQYIRVGNTVTFALALSADPAGTGSTIVEVSLPIASAFTTNLQASGTCTTPNSNFGVLVSDATDDRFQIDITAVTITNVDIRCSGSYQVL